MFNQIYQTTDNRHQLDCKGDAKEVLVKKMLHRLGRAIASDEIRGQMDIEDEIERAFEREMQTKDEIIAQKGLQLKEQ